MALYLIFLLRLGKIRLETFDICIVCLFIVFTIMKTYQSSIYDTLFSFRYFLGFLIFYFYFKSGKGINVDKLLLILSCAVIVEAILINTIISPESLPNYPDFELAYTHRTNFFGFYQRPYSFGGSASVTSCLLVALLALRKNDDVKVLILSVFAVLISMAGSGYLCLLLFLYFRNKKWFFALLSIVLLFLIYSGYRIGLDSDLVKISPAYFLSLAELKLQSIVSSHFFDNLFQMLFGMNVDFENGEIGGDFAMFSLVYSQGIIITSLFLLLIAYRMNRNNYQALSIMMVATFHYGVMFFFPGQILLAYALSKKKSID